MFVLKFLIGILSIFVFTKIGFDKSKKYKNVVSFYDSLCLLCDRFLVELQYKKSHLDNILKDSYSSVDAVRLFNSHLENKNDLVFPSYINEEEKVIIKDFFKKLGQGDTDSQKIFINSFKKIFENNKDNYKIEFKKYSNLYLKIGFMCGLTLMIVVI